MRDYDVRHESGQEYGRFYAASPEAAINMGITAGHPSASEAQRQRLRSAMKAAPLRNYEVWQEDELIGTYQSRHGQEAKNRALADRWPELEGPAKRAQIAKLSVRALVKGLRNRTRNQRKLPKSSFIASTVVDDPVGVRYLVEAQRETTGSATITPTVEVRYYVWEFKHASTRQGPTVAEGYGFDTYLETIRKIKETGL